MLVNYFVHEIEWETGRMGQQELGNWYLAGGCAANSAQREKVSLRSGDSVAFCVFRVATLCRFLGGLGDLGWNWVYIGGRGWGRRNCQNRRN